MFHLYYVIIPIVVLLVGGLIFTIIFTMKKAIEVNTEQVRRKPSTRWQRGECGFPDFEENVEMFNRGMAWAEENSDCINEVEVHSDGLKLRGQYFDFGFNRAVVILCGRAEACTYSYYFAVPYRKLCYNVLVIDNRATGESEGEYNCVGLREYMDLLEWIKMLHDDFGNKQVLIHSVCIGSATSIYAATSGKCPDYVCGIIAEGMFTTFYETFKTHMRYLKKPVFPVALENMAMVRRETGKSPIFNGPIYSIRYYKKPLLMLHGRQDVFSLPKRAEELFEACASEDKQLIWFEKGSHSHLRINDEEKYDAEIEKFVNSRFPYEPDEEPDDEELMEEINELSDTDEAPEIADDAPGEVPETLPEMDTGDSSEEAPAEE